MPTYSRKLIQTHQKGDKSSTGNQVQAKPIWQKALASESGVNFISVKGPQILSRYIGESEKGVRELFRMAKQASPCILFLDEIDSLTPRRSNDSSGSGVIDRVIGQFLTEMDGIEDLKGVNCVSCNQQDRFN